MFGTSASLALLIASASATCIPCDPSGWTTTTSPTINDGLTSLYTDLLSSVAGIHFKRSQSRYSPFDERAKAPPICCAETTQCLIVKNRGIPFCYDKFTTNFIFPDGAHGNLNSGDYSTTNSNTVNLVSGVFGAGTDQQGNIYGGNPDAKPNTATLSIPPLYTASGVGGPIPVDQLKGQYTISTYTAATVIPGTTNAGTTVPAKTISSPTTITMSAVSTATVTATATVRSNAMALYAKERPRLLKTLVALGAVSGFVVCVL